MSGLPRTSAKNRDDRCTGDWACTVEIDGQHCVCYMDAVEPGDELCCQCDGADNDPPFASPLVKGDG